MLGDGHCDPGGIGLLESVFADHVGWNLTGNRNHRNGIHHRCSDARDQIRRAGPGSPEADTDIASDAGISVGHMGCALFMTAQDMSERVLK